MGARRAGVTEGRNHALFALTGPGTVRIQPAITEGAGQWPLQRVTKGRHVPTVF